MSRKGANWRPEKNEIGREIVMANLPKINLKSKEAAFAGGGFLLFIASIIWHFVGIIASGGIFLYFAYLLLKKGKEA